MSNEKEKTQAAHPRRSPWAIRPIITEAELAEEKEPVEKDPRQVEPFDE